MKILKILTINIILTCIFTVLIFEIYFRIHGESRQDLTLSLKRSFSKTPIPLLQNDKNPIEYNVLSNDGRLVTTAQIVFDQFGRRETPQSYQNKYYSLFFGCSYTFGTGLKQDETLGSYFSQLSYSDVYNYAREGFSPTDFLRQTEMLDFKQQISKDYISGNAYYFYYGFQWRRAIPSLLWIAKRGAGVPYYDWNANEKTVSYKGSYGQVFPNLSRLISIISKLHMFHYLPNIRYIKSKRDNPDFFCAIFNKSFSHLKNKLTNFNKLIIVLPLFKNTRNWAELPDRAQTCLAQGIEILKINVDKRISEVVIDPIYEYHPTKEFNEFLSKQL